MNVIAWWPHTSNPQIASVRLRCFQVVAELHRQGIQAGVYAPGQQPPQTLVLSKRYDADSIRHAITLREASGTRLVLDLCDNHFYTSSTDPIWKARADSLREAVRTVDLVVASTPTLARYIEAECPGHPDIVVVGDAVEGPRHATPLQRIGSPWAELQLMRLKNRLCRSRIAKGRRLLWFGNHGSGNAEGGMTDLLLIRENLERASKQALLSLTVISNSEKKFRQITANLAFDTFYLDWQSTTFSRAAALHDVAVIPVGHNPFTICKTNNRVATAFMHSLAVVADSIPSYEEFSESAVLDDWGQGLDLLMENHTARTGRIQRGIQTVKDHWNLANIAAEWTHALNLNEYSSPQTS
jgi:hypothetical protein